MRVSGSSRPLYVEIAERIEEAVMRGEWPPGRRLPPLAELAVQFGVSRAVVRESCSMLVGSGLLELRHGDGTYVRAFDEETFRRPLHAAVLLASSEARSLLEAGLWLERGTADAAARKRTDEHCARLSEALFTMETGIGSMDVFLMGEAEFHLALAEASGNRMAVNLLRILYEPLSGVLRLIGRDEEVQRTITTIHQTLFDSVKGLDPEAAQRQVMLYRTFLLERATVLRDVRLEPAPKGGEH